MMTIERKSYAKRVLAMILLVLMAFNVVGDTALAAASAAASFQGDATGRNVRYSSRISAPYRAEAVATAVPVLAVTEVPAAETQATSAPVQESVSAEETAVPQEETAAPVETAVPEVTAAP